jgi:hypothetical protein
MPAKPSVEGFAGLQFREGEAFAFGKLNTKWCEAGAV